MSPANPQILQLKVSLRGVRPPIWRRLLVRSDVPLDRFHRILQLVMGWTDSHLHEFHSGEDRYGMPEPGGNEDEELAPERRVRLEQLLQQPKDRLVYLYDFGDGWEHDIVLEAVLPGERGMKYPIVLAGKRACPPEDVGGVWGYADFLEILRSPGGLEREDTLTWSGGSFDPEAFDPQAVNRAFHGGWASAVQRETAPVPVKRTTLPTERVGEVARLGARLAPTKILSDDEAVLVAGGLRELLGDGVLRLSPSFDLEAFVRFQAVAEKCREARTARGLDLKQAARALRVRQDDLRRIEGAGVGHLNREHLDRYLDFLGLRRWYGRWKRAHPETAARLGFAAARAR